MRLPVRLLPALLFALAGAATSEGHEFIAKPAAMTAAAGGKLAVTGVSSHVFITSQELETAQDVRLGFVSGGRRVEAPAQPNEKTLGYDATVDAPSGPFWITGARLPQVWATTPDGVKPATNRTPGAFNAFRIEKFSKALVNASADDKSFATPLGDTLEIVPLTNPATLKVGDELPVKVLYKGQPLTTNIYATYDGFSSRENTYAYFTEGLPDGTAFVKITHPGLWMVRVQHTAPEKTADYDRYVGRAVLLVNVP